MLKAFRYQIFPTEAQKTLLSKTFGCVRWVYNYALAEKQARYIEAGSSPSLYELQAHLPQLKEREETKWLEEVPAAALQASLRNLDAAFTQFFNKQSAYPRFKSRYDRHDSFQLPQHTKLDFGTQHIQIIGFKEGIKGCFNRRFEGKIKTTTISQTPTGKYYASVLVETSEVEPTPQPADEATAIGLDFNLKDLVVTSDGRRFVNPRALKRYLRRLRIRSRRHSRTAKDSKRREKARLRLALTHEKISNVRTNNLHQISSELTRKNHGVSTLCIEDLSVSSMVTDSSRGKAMNRSIMDAGWRELRRQLEYKCRWYGLNLRVIGRWEASSKTCSHCGHVHSGLTLADRTWTCVACDTTHDRDENAARNIKRMAFSEQNTSSGSLLPDNYRQARRKVTPEDQPHVVEMSRECQISDHLGQIG